MLGEQDVPVHVLQHLPIHLLQGPALGGDSLPLQVVHHLLGIGLADGPVRQGVGKFHRPADKVLHQPANVLVLFFDCLTHESRLLDFLRLSCYHKKLKL